MGKRGFDLDRALLITAGVLVAVLLLAGLVAVLLPRKAVGLPPRYAVAGVAPAGQWVKSGDKGVPHAGGCSMPGTKGGSKGSCADNPELDPILECSYNAKNIVKQSILLEDHLNNPAKMCISCCNKHFLAICALSEEAISLADNDKDKKRFQELARYYDKLHQSCQKGEKPTDVADKLRKTRNELTAEYV